MQLDSITAIVTGTASGLGAATYRFLNECGAKIVGLKMAFINRQTISGSILQQPSNVANKASAQTALVVAVAVSRPTHILIACGGIAENYRLLGCSGIMPLEQFWQLIDGWYLQCNPAVRRYGPKFGTGFH